MSVGVRGLLFLLFLSSALAAAIPPVLNDYLQPGQIYSTQVIAQAQGHAYILTFNGAETLMADDWNNALVTDAGQIGAQLKYGLQQTIGWSDAQSALTAAISDLQARQKEPERICAQYTGMDHLACDDQHSCLQAAQGSPQAQQMSQAQGFWQAMLSWNNGRKALNASRVSLTAQGSASASADAAHTIVSGMESVRSNVDVLNVNPLVLDSTNSQCQGSSSTPCFNFCPKMNWTASTTGWTSLEGRFSSMASQLDSLNAQDARAAALARAETSWIRYLQDQKDQAALAAAKQKAQLALAHNWSLMNNSLQASQTMISGQMANVSVSLWQDAPLQADWMAWKMLANQTRALADGGNFEQALTFNASLMASAQNISARIEENSRLALSIQVHVASIESSFDALIRLGDHADIEAVAPDRNALKSAIHYPILSSKLSGLENQSQALDNRLVPMVARAQALAQKAVVPNVTKNATTSHPLNASSNGSANANATLAPVSISPLAPLKAMGCPLAIGLAALAFALAIGSARMNGEK